MKTHHTILIALLLSASNIHAVELRQKAFPDNCLCDDELIIEEPAATAPVAKPNIRDILSPFEMNAAYQAILVDGSKVRSLESSRLQKTSPLENRQRTSFAWGGDVGASIDLSGNDMSSIDFNLSAGVRRGWINFLGVGAGADFAVSNSTRAYPFFVEFRTNFTNHPTICFWQLRLGGAYNMLEHNHEQVGFYGTTGIGINLARGKNFCSHLLLCYTYRQRNRVVGTEMTHEFTDLHFASVKIGVTF